MIHFSKYRDILFPFPFLLPHFIIPQLTPYYFSQYLGMEVVIWCFHWYTDVGKNDLRLLLEWCEFFWDTIGFIVPGLRKSFQVLLIDEICLGILTDLDICHKAWPGELSNLLCFPSFGQVLNVLCWLSGRYIMSPLCICRCSPLHRYWQLKFSPDVCTSKLNHISCDVFWD